MAQCVPIVTHRGQRVDAANWSVRQIVDWLHSGQGNQNQRQLMLGHLSAKATVEMQQQHQSWTAEHPEYRYSTRDPGSVESFYFESTVNPGKFGRLRSQHVHGPTATAFRYTTQMCGTKIDAQRVQIFFKQHPGVTLEELTEYGKSLGMGDGLLPGMAHIEIFTAGPADQGNQAVTNVHQSGGKVDLGGVVNPDMDTWFQTNQALLGGLAGAETFNVLFDRPK